MSFLKFLLQQKGNEEIHASLSCLIMIFSCIQVSQTIEDGTMKQHPCWECFTALTLLEWHLYKK